MFAGAQLKMHVTMNSKLFHEGIMSRSELGFSLLEGFFPGGGVGPLPLGKINCWPVLYSVLRVPNVK